MLVKSLVQDAYIWAQIIAERGESADATQLRQGSTLLNIILRTINITGREIGLITKEDFTLIAGQNFFQLDNFTKLLKVQFLLGNTLLDIVLMDLNDFYNNARIQTTKGIPYQGYAQRTPAGIELQLFFIPSENYPITVQGYKDLGPLDLNDTLAGIESFMQDYLLFKLAYKLQTYYQLPPTQFILEEVAALDKKLETLHPKRTDINIRRVGDSTYGRGLPFLNLGRGWMP